MLLTYPAAGQIAETALLLYGVFFALLLCLRSGGAGPPSFIGSLFLRVVPSTTDRLQTDGLPCASFPNAKYDDGLAFIHVSKAGGTSYRAFFQALARECGYPSHVNESPLWVDLTDEQRAQTRVYGGTNHLGYYDLLRSWPGHEHGSGNVAFFTQLRHPWERAASDYYYAKSLGPLHHNYELTQTLNVTEWILGTEDGGMLSYFASIAGGDRAQRRCCFDREDLREVKDLLRDTFAVVGLVEERQMTLEILRCSVPWIAKAIGRNASLGNLPHLNENPAGDYKHAHDAASFEVDSLTVEKVFPLDWELYQYAKSLLYERHEKCLERGDIVC